MSTPNDIIVAAVARSTKNRADVLASSSELLRVVGSSLRGAYSIAAEVNPIFFGTSEDVVFASPGWARPALAESVFRIELATTGAEVVLVPYDDLAAETGKPAVYMLGQVYRSAGNALDPVSGSLRIYYSPIPAVPATVATAIDATWPTKHDSLLINDMATYLALKDGRMDEAQLLAAERDQSLSLFVRFLEHETTNLRRRFGHLRKTNSQSIEVLSRSMASGQVAA